MSMVTIEAPDGSERQCIAEADLAAYPGWTVIAQGAPDDAHAVIEDGAWTVPLDVLRARAWERVKQLRAEKKAAGTTVPGVGPVQTDDISTQNITGLVVMAQIALAAGQPFAEPFTLADDSVVTFDAAGMIAMGVAVGQHVAAVYARARDLREAIAAAAAADELAALDLETGWE